jgi:hypothetical protein
LARLHGHDVGQAQRELEHLLDADHPLAGWDRRAQRVQQRRLPGLCSAGHQDVETGHHGRLEETRGLVGQGARRDDLVQAAQADRELADVHRQS